jgi:hypothetical protein
MLWADMIHARLGNRTGTKPLGGGASGRHDPAMTDRYVVRKDSSGFTVADNFTGEPLVLAMDPQTGLSEEDAQHTADLFNKRARQGERAIHE